MTPRPSYPADGRKIFDSYSQPADLRDELQAKLGVFDLNEGETPGTQVYTLTAPAETRAGAVPKAKTVMTAAPRAALPVLTA